MTERRKDCSQFSFIYIFFFFFFFEMSRILIRKVLFVNGTFVKWLYFYEEKNSEWCKRIPIVKVSIFRVYVMSFCYLKALHARLLIYVRILDGRRL